MKEKILKILNVLYPYLIGFAIGTIFSIFQFGRIIDTYNDYSNHEFNLSIREPKISHVNPSNYIEEEINNNNNN